MDLKGLWKRTGFTLMEIMISVFIVAILIAITVPIVKKQIDKTEDYAYYMAYKTVEKMAGQIVAMGDPEEIDDITAMSEPEIKLADRVKNSVKTFVADSGKKVKIFITRASGKIAKAEEYMFRKMFPKAFAESVTIQKKVYTLSSDEYDQLWVGIQVCNGNKFIPKSQTTDPETSEVKYEYYSKEDFENCIGYGQAGELSGITIGAYDNLTVILPANCPNYEAYQNKIVTEIKKQSSPNAREISMHLIAACSGTIKDSSDKIHTFTMSYELLEDEGDVDDEDDDEDYGGSTGGINAGNYVELPSTPEADQGEFVQKEEYEMDVNDDGAATQPTAKPEFPVTYCNNTLQTFHMKNQAAPTSVDCVCEAGRVASQNNDRACCPPCTGDALPYYHSDGIGDANKCVCCSTDFNPKSGKCCPKNSIYVSGNDCTCISGYGPAGVCNVLETCPPGTTKDDKENVCVVNPPVLKASRFCELVKEYYNTNNTNCNAGFKTLKVKNTDVHYNEDVYKAASSASGTYLSIQSKAGAFANITPNIVFSNGLPMWILADKTASIPGLTYTTQTEEPTQNICLNLRKHKKDKCKDVDNKAYFCKGENTCFSLDDKALTTMGDARNCCATTDFSDIVETVVNNPGTYEDKAYEKDKRVYSIGGFTVFVDINGQNKGSGTLWEDVFPFFIGANGTVYPAYPIDAEKDATKESSLYLGGNSEKQLAVDVYYYKDAGVTREKVVAFPGVSYARGVCSARLLSKYAPYCQNIGEKFKDGMKPITGSDEDSNPCNTHRCYISVRQKLRSF
ncbi:MAG: type IV pilin protein [Candidatus Gastranaerophilaceae bacterium]